MDYLVIIEKSDDGSFSAYVPDLPGCVACADSRDEVSTLIAEAVRLHTESLRQHGEPLPLPSTTATTVRAA